MAKTATTTTAATRPPAKSGSGGGLSKKLGPLPVWAWGVGAVAVIVIAYYVYKQHQAASTQAVAPAPDDTNGSDVTDGGLAGSGVNTSGSGSADDSAALDQVNANLDALSAGLLTTTSQLEQEIALNTASLTDLDTKIGSLAGSGVSGSSGSVITGGIGAVTSGQAPTTAAVGPVPDISPNSASAQSAEVHAKALQPGGGGRLAAPV